MPGVNDAEVDASDCDCGLNAVRERAPTHVVRTLEHAPARVRRLASPVACVRLHAGMLLSGGGDGRVKLWSLAAEDAQEVTTIHAATRAPVQGVVLSSLAGYVAIAAGDRLEVWRPNANAAV